MRSGFIALFALLPLAAQEIKLPASFDRLAEKATEVVDVTLDSSLLQLASKFLSDKGEDAQAKKVVAGLKGIYVRSFEFDKPGQYDLADVEAVRSQMRGPGWSRIVGVSSKKKGENSEVYLKSEGGKVVGMGIISAEPKELVIVSIVGAIDPEQLQELGGHFGVPKLGPGGKQKKDDEE